MSGCNDLEGLLGPSASRVLRRCASTRGYLCGLVDMLSVPALIVVAIVGVYNKVCKAMRVFTNGAFLEVLALAIPAPSSRSISEVVERVVRSGRKVTRLLVGADVPASRGGIGWCGRPRSLSCVFIHLQGCRGCC